MNCESVVKLIPLYFYGELPPEEEDRLEQHLDGCAACSREAERYRTVAAALDRREMRPSGALLAECRQDVMRAVYRNEAPAMRTVRGTPWAHFREGFTTLFPPLFRWRVPLGATALVALGFVSARLTMPGSGAIPLNTASVIPATDIISSVRSVQPAPEGAQPGEVRIVLDETRRRVVSGPLEDRNIQRLMLAAAHDENDPSVRVESVDILKSHSDSSEIRSLLLNRVVQDPNPGVRLKALDGLKPYIDDPEVRKVLAQVLLQDDNPGVRIQAVDALTSHADDNLVGVLQSVVQKENNSYVRRRCANALKEMNASVGTF
jgi:anti-sigma factor RsiW